MRVVIAEDLVLLRQSLVRLFTAHDIEVVAEVGETHALLAAVTELRPDLVLCDVRMPPTFTDEGARAARLLRTRFPELAVVMLSHIVEPGLALEIIADRPARFGYLLKDRILDLDGFVHLVRQVAAGGTAIDEQLVERLLGNHESPALGRLSEREREVLSLIAQGLSNISIAERLFVSERTVDAHLRSIFTKLDLPPTVEHNRRVVAALAWMRGGAPDIGAGTDARDGV